MPFFNFFAIEKMDRKSLQIKLNENEHLTSLDKYNLWLIQRSDWFSLGEDSVALSEFVQIKPGEKVLEAGTGNGGLLLMLYGKEPKASYTAIEVMKNNVDLAKRNLEINGITENTYIVHGDYRKFSVETYGNFDKIICNPPYEKLGEGRISPIPEVAAAKFELNGTLTDFFAKTKELLSIKGSFYLVLPLKRAEEVYTLAENFGFLIAESQKKIFNKQKKQQEKGIVLFRLTHK